MSATPRTLVFSQRNAVSRKWQAALYEFEDVVAEVDSVELLAPAGRNPSAFTRVSNRLVRARGHRERVGQAAIEPVTVTGEYDLFFAVFSFPNEIPDLLQLKQWRERCDKAVCFILEVYSEQVMADAKPYLEMLARFRFDEVFVFNPRPRDAIARLTRSRVDFMATGVDAFRFSPYPNAPARSVDFYEIGRHSMATHAAALDMARRDGAFYLYDTVFNVPLPNYRSHRELMAEVMKRSRYFFAYRAGEDRPSARGDDPLSSRYFEGIAGGAVLLGSRPNAPEWDDCLGWPDSVIEIPYDAHDLREIVSDLEAQSERLMRARINNLVNTLRRHDWVYRWCQVLDVAGLPHTEAMAERIDRLQRLSTITEQGERTAARVQ